MNYSTSHVPSSDGNAPGRESAAERFFGLWRRGERPAVDTFLQEVGTLSVADVAAVLRVDQRERWRSGEPVQAESYLQRHPGLHAEADCAVDLIYNEFLLREKLGQRPTAEEYLRRFPHFADVLGPQIELHRAMAVGSVDPSQAVTTDSRSARAESDERLPQIPGYEVHGVLGRGGMGVVYKARQLALHRLVALKMLRAGALADEEHHQRFEAEAAAVGRLGHPNIVQVHDYGTHEGSPYLVLEYVEGGMLAQQIAGVPQPPDRAAQIVETLALAMEHAHGQGLVHRDLKPANVLITAEGVLKIADFGLAKHLRDEAGSPTRDGHTVSGALVGTPRYMAPEQIAAEYGVIGPATDVYALGVILYELLTGRPPFHGDSVLDLLQKIREQDPAPPSRLRLSVPRDLETICLKCLHKSPTQRYPSAASLAEDLGRFRAGEPIRARPPGVVERVVKWTRRRPAIAALLLVVALVTALGIGVAAAQYQRIVRHAEAETAAKVETQEHLAKAQTNLYFASLTLTEREWHDGSLARVRAFLDDSPPEHRGWEWYYYRDLCEAAVGTLRGHTAPVMVLKYSPDGKHLASTGEDRQIRLWDVSTGAARHTLAGHVARPTSLAFSPDNRWLLSGSYDETLRLWDGASGRQAWQRRLRGVPFSVAFLSASWHAVIGVGDDDDRTKPGEVQIWDIREGRLVRTLSGHATAVKHVACDVLGKRLASGDEDGEVRIWDAQTGTLLHTLPPRKTTTARGLSFVLLDEFTGRRAGVNARTPSVQGLVFSANGERLVASTGEGVLRVWEAESGKPVTVPPAPAVVRGAPVLSPTGPSLAMLGMDHRLHVWNLTTGREERIYRNPTHLTTGIAFHPDGRHVATAGMDYRIKVWDVSQEQGTVLLGDVGDGVFGLAFSPDSRHLAAGSGDMALRIKPGKIQIWDLATRRPLKTLLGHKGGVSAVAYNNAGTRLASAGADGTVRVWDVEFGREELRLLGHTDMVFCVAFSPDGRYLVSGSSSFPVVTLRGQLIVWDAGTGKEIRTLHGHQGGISSVTFAPDGRLASAGADRTIRMWDVDRGAELWKLEEPTDTMLRMTYSPDGHYLAAGGGMLSLAGLAAPGEAKLWDAATGAEVRSFKGHTQMISGVAFSKQGRRLLTSSRDGTVKVWDTRTGRQAGSLRASDRYINNLAVSPDGRCVASGNWNGTVNVWQANLPRGE